MARSKWKGLYINTKILKLPQNSTPVVLRDSHLSEVLVEKFIQIHTGKEYKKVFVNKDKLGLKAGMLSATKKTNIKEKIQRKKK